MILVGNKLFDLLALNPGAAEFFKDEFEDQKSSTLLRYSETPRFKNACRHNPLELPDSLNEYGISL